MNEIQKTQQYWFFFVLFFVLLTYPILSVFNKGEFLGEFPLSLVYMFIIWLIIIISIFILNSYRIKKSDKKFDR